MAFRKEAPISTIDDLVAAMPPGEVWCRGHADASWRLVPSLFRTGFQGSLRAVESSLKQLFRSQAPSRRSACPSDEQEAEWMLLMQHYGIPTRILDWTTSPLSALFFALSDERLDGQDGALYFLNPNNLNLLCTRVPGVRTLPSSLVRQMALGLSTSGVDAEVVALRPPELDVRLSAQASAVTLHASARSIEDIVQGVMDANRLLRVHAIPSAAKPALRRAVEILGVNQSTIFPDLHHLGREVVRRVRRIDEEEIERQKAREGSASGNS